MTGHLYHLGYRSLAWIANRDLASPPIEQRHYPFWTLPQEQPSYWYVNALPAR